MKTVALTQFQDRVAQLKAEGNTLVHVHLVESEVVPTFWQRVVSTLRYLWYSEEGL